MSDFFTLLSELDFLSACIALPLLVLFASFALAVLLYFLTGLLQLVIGLLCLLAGIILGIDKMARRGWALLVATEPACRWLVAKVAKPLWIGWLLQRSRLGKDVVLIRNHKGGVIVTLVLCVVWLSHPPPGGTLGIGLLSYSLVAAPPWFVFFAVKALCARRARRRASSATAHNASQRSLPGSTPRS